jgi:hypothetical protein
MRLILLCWLLWFFALALLPEVRFRNVLLAVVAYSSALFVMLSDWLMDRGGAWLTKKRGEQWVKEIDYIYLGLAFVGLLVSITRLEVVSDKIAFPGVLGLIIISTAIVLRAVKTRAEVGAWNKR